jgi:hypothetical protein
LQASLGANGLLSIEPLSKDLKVMRHFLSAPVAIAALGLAAVAAPAFAQSLAVPIDQSMSINLPGDARDVVIGNPLVVDVNLLNARTAVVMGKAYGVTSLQVFDGQGRSIYARQVVVSSSDDNRVAFYKGANVTNYACSPRCERTPMPGELDKELSPYITGYTSYADRQKSLNAAANSAPPAP